MPLEHLFDAELHYREDIEPVVSSEGRDGPSYRNWCAALNFFASGERVLGYLAPNPGVSGRAIPMPEAIQLGRTIFGDLGRMSEDSKQGAQ